MRAAGFWVGLVVGMAGVSAAGALDIRNHDGVYDIVEGSKILGTFWDPKTGQSDVKFTAEAGVKPKFLWSEDHRYLAANGGALKNRQLYLYKIEDDSNWTPVAIGDLTPEQLALLNAIEGKWAASGTEALRWEEDNTLLIRVWATSPVGEMASIWPNLKMDGAKSEIVGVSTEEPMERATATEAEAEPVRLDPEKLVGEHPYVGRNPDGSEYKGTVAIRLKGPLLLLQWKVGETVTHGTGLLEDMTLGMALESGVAIYQAVPQAEGISLVGLWKTEGAKSANEETILIENADTTEAKFEVHKVNGEYQFQRELTDGSSLKGRAKITGGDVVKKIALDLPDDTFAGEGLLLGEGLAVITPEGLAVYARTEDDNFSGHSVNGRGEVVRETLRPTE